MARPRKRDRIEGLTNGDSAYCPDQVVHVDAVREARAGLPSSSIVADMTAVFAALGDPTRLRIVAALANQELCVCDLAATLSISQSAISHQLRALRQLGLVKPRRAGRLVYYALDDEHVSTLFEQAHDHVSHQPGEQP